MKRLFGVKPLETQNVEFAREMTVYTEDDSVIYDIGDIVVYDGGDGLYLGTIKCYYRVEIGTETKRLLVSKVDMSILEKEKKKAANARRLEEIIAKFPDAITVVKEHLEAKFGKQNK